MPPFTDEEKKKILENVRRAKPAENRREFKSRYKPAKMPDVKFPQIGTPAKMPEIDPSEIRNAKSRYR